MIRDDRDLRATFEGALSEAFNLGRAEDVALADNFVESQMEALDSLPYEMKASMLHDLTAGRRLEAPWLSGTVAEMSEAAGFDAPISRTLFAAMKPYIGGT